MAIADDRLSEGGERSDDGSNPQHQQSSTTVEEGRTPTVEQPMPAAENAESPTSSSSAVVTSDDSANSAGAANNEPRADASVADGAEIYLHLGNDTNAGHSSGSCSGSSGSTSRNVTVAPVEALATIAANAVRAALIHRVRLVNSASVPSPVARSGRAASAANRSPRRTTINRSAGTARRGGASSSAEQGAAARPRCTMSGPQSAASFHGANLRRQDGQTNLLNSNDEPIASAAWWQWMLLQLGRQHAALQCVHSQLQVDCQQAERYIRLMDIARMRLLQARQQVAQQQPGQPSCSGNAELDSNGPQQAQSHHQRQRSASTPATTTLTDGQRNASVCATQPAPLGIRQPRAECQQATRIRLPTRPPSSNAVNSGAAAPTFGVPPRMCQPGAIPRAHSSPATAAGPRLCLRSILPRPIGPASAGGAGDGFNASSTRVPPTYSPEFHPGSLLSQFHPGHFADGSIHAYIDLLRMHEQNNRPNQPGSCYGFRAYSPECLALMGAPEFRQNNPHLRPPYLDHRFVGNSVFPPAYPAGGCGHYNCPGYRLPQMNPCLLYPVPSPLRPAAGYGNCPAPPNTPVSSSSNLSQQAAFQGISPSQLAHALQRLAGSHADQSVRTAADGHGPNHRGPPPPPGPDGSCGPDGRFRGGADTSSDEEYASSRPLSGSNASRYQRLEMTNRRNAAGVCPSEICEPPKPESCGKGAATPGSLAAAAAGAALNKNCGERQSEQVDTCGAQQRESDAAPAAEEDPFAAAARKQRKIKPSPRTTRPFETTQADDEDDRILSKQHQPSRVVTSSGSAEDLDTMLKNLSLGYSEGASLKLPEGLVPTYTSSGGSYRPQQVPPPDYCANVTTPPACVRDLQLEIPKTGEVTITDDVDECINEHCPTWVNLDVTWNESGNFKINIERVPEPTCADEKKKRNERERAILERDAAVRKLKGLPEVTQGRSDANDVESRRSKKNTPIQITRQLYGGAVLDESTFEKVRTKWYSVDPKKAFGCCDCSQIPDGDEEPPVSADCLELDDKKTKRNLELNMTYLQAPPPLVPIHQIVEKLNGREPTGWSIEEVEELAEFRLRSIRSLRKNICEFGFEVRHSPGRCRQLTPQQNNRLHYASKISGALAVLIDLVESWRHLNVERLRYKSLVAGSVPRSGPGLNCGDAGFCLTARDYVNAEVRKLAELSLMCRPDDADESAEERKDGGDLDFE